MRSIKTYPEASARYKHRHEPASRASRQMRLWGLRMGRRQAHGSLAMWVATLFPVVGISLVYMGIARGEVALSTLLASFACGIFLIRFCKGF